MRTTRLQGLALCLSIGALVGYGGLHDAASAATLLPATTASSQCQALPLPSPTPSATASASASPTDSASATTSASSTGSAAGSTDAVAAVAADPTPADLCISVQASQDSFQAGQKATWTVQVWAPNGPVTGVTVYLTGTMADQPPVFSGQCPGGNGSTLCYVGDLATDGTASSETMQAQITVPSGTAVGTSVTLTGTADPTPALATMPSAATTVTVAAAPAPANSPSASASAASASASAASASASASAAGTKSATPAAPGQPAVTPGTTGTVTLPGIGTIPALAAPGTSPTGVTAITNPGNISNLLPVISPGPSATSPAAGFMTSPAADNANAGTTADRSSASDVVLVIPTATAEKLGVVLLLVLIAVALRMRAKDKLFPRVRPDRASRGARSGKPAPTRWLKPAALLHPRRQPDGGPKKT